METECRARKYDIFGMKPIKRYARFFQDVVICDLDFSASQFALVRVVHSQT